MYVKSKKIKTKIFLFKILDSWPLSRKVIHRNVVINLENSWLKESIPPNRKKYLIYQEQGSHGVIAGEGASLFRNWHSDFQNNFNSSRQEEKLEKLEGMVALESADAYIYYNAMIRGLNNHCIRYLDILDTRRYDDEGGSTKLDRYRVNFCRNEIENILKRISINGELPNNNYIRIAMVHGYQYLGKVKKLREDVSRFYFTRFFLTTFLWFE